MTEPHNYMRHEEAGVVGGSPQAEGLELVPTGSPESLCGGQIPLSPRFPTLRLGDRYLRVV